MRALPNPFNVLPREMDTEKLKILIEEGKVRFTKDILDAFADKNDLQVQFVSKNIPQYLDNPGDYELNDDLKEALLQTPRKIRTDLQTGFERLSKEETRSYTVVPVSRSIRVNSSLSNP